MKYLVLLLSVLTLFAIPATSHAIGVELAVGGWEQSPSGKVSYDAADEIDLEDDADFEKEQRIYGRAKLDMPAFVPNIYLMYTPMSFDGEGTKSLDFTFGDVTFQANADFETDLKLNQTDLALYYGLPFVQTASAGVLNVELGLNIRRVDFSVEVQGTESGTGISEKESQSADLYVPMLYAGVQVSPTDFVSVEAEYRGISVSGNSFSDIIGRLKVKPFGPVFIAAGYRQQSLDIDEEDVEVDMDFKGPFIEAGVQF